MEPHVLGREVGRVRVRPLLRSLPVALFGLVIAGAVPGQASTVILPSSSPPVWHVVYTLPDGTYLYDLFGITATGPRDAWAFGRAAIQGKHLTPVLRHWDGHSWRAVLAPPGLPANWSAAAPIPAGSSSPSNVWAFNLGHWAHWSGRRWAVGRLPLPLGYSGSVNITSTAVLSPSDVWVVGNLTSASIIPYLAHFNGRRWRFQLPSPDAVSMVAISASGPDNVWVAGNAGANLLSRWNGHSWQKVPMPAALAGPTTFGGLVVLSADSVWITGLVPGAAASSFVGGAWHWDGHHWRMYRLSTACALTEAAPDGHGGLWASFANPCNPARLWHEAAGRWTSRALPDYGPCAYVEQLTAVPGTAAMLAAGVVYPRGKLSAAILQYGQLP
jgi:hypothetical protein